MTNAILERPCMGRSLHGDMATLPTAEVEDAPYGGSLDHLRDELARIDLLIRGQVARARRDDGDAWRGLSISDAEVDALLARGLGARHGMPATARSTMCARWPTGSARRSTGDVRARLCRSRWSSSRAGLR